MTTRQEGIEFGGERLVFNYTDRADYEVIDSLRLGLELVRSSDADAPEGFDMLTGNVPKDSEASVVVRALGEDVQEIGDSSSVSSLPINSRANISGAYKTNLAIFESEVPFVLDVLKAAEAEADEKPQLNIPHGFFSSSIEMLSSETVKQAHKNVIKPIALKPRLKKVEGGGEDPGRSSAQLAAA